MKITLTFLAVTAALSVSWQATGWAANRANLQGLEGLFFSENAQHGHDDGSPVGPKPKVLICHKGHTLKVTLAAVPGHLAHGDTLGPCPPKPPHGGGGGNNNGGGGGNNGGGGGNNGGGNGQGGNDHGDGNKRGLSGF